AADRISDPRSGRRAEIETIGSGGGSVQALTYAWDLQGNLTSRDDAISGRRETYGYDALDRITRATLATAGGAATFAYAAIGTLAYKTGVGAYAYPAPGEPRPHAVERVGGDPRRLQY